MARPKAATPREAVTSVRLPADEKEAMTAAADEQGFSNLSEYIRHLHKMHKREALKARSLAPARIRGSTSTFHKTALGRMIEGDALQFMFHDAAEESVDLVMTSPPFGLVRKKPYGNEDAAAYCEWFRPFAEGFRRILRPNGSLVIDIGGAWKAGSPTRSLYHFELLVMLCNEFGFHLCQEHYWWNPSKLPSPAEWVNVRRVRVKDAVNCVWWLSPTPWPRANNKKVLAPYSDAMKAVLKHGCTAKQYPSGHSISENFSRDNGGSVPPNLLAIANTESNGQYQSYCREKDLPIHPARFPGLLPEYFIRFLTNPGDMVFDPFGGSCVTGAVAESLGRKWVCTELDRSYLLGAVGRFTPPPVAPSASVRLATYEITAPCSSPADERLVEVEAHGGRTRTNDRGSKAASGAVASTPPLASATAK